MYEYKAKLERVVDGDTIDATIDLGFDVFVKKRIRFAGINAPESRTRDLKEKAFGLAAKDRVKSILAENPCFTLESTELGKYGRVLGSIVVDNLDINQAMVAQNLAVKYFGQSKADVEVEHLANRQKLIDSGAYIPDSDI